MYNTCAKFFKLVFLFNLQNNHILYYENTIPMFKDIETRTQSLSFQLLAYKYCAFNQITASKYKGKL